MAKKIIINNDMVKQTKTHILNLFKPIANPFLDRPVSEGGSNANNYALQTYPGPATIGLTGAALTTAMTNNPVATHYNNKNIITNLFLVTQDFITFIDKINTIWESDAKSRVLTNLPYKRTATGFIVPDSTAVDTSALTTLLPIIEGPTANAASNFDAYEKFALNGLWGTGSSAVYGVASTSIQELFLRNLYSLNAEKRNIAFKIAEVYYSIPTVTTTAANKGLIPAINFNSDNLSITENKDEITLDYANPIEFSPHYDQTIQNPTGQNLYLYFPYMTINAHRPGATRMEDGNHHEGYISIYTGVKPPYFATTSSITTTLNPSSVFENASFAYAAPQSAAVNPSYGAYTDNANMPVLTNSIWNETAGKWVNQAGYTAIHITETGLGGDITFDHTDKIDYIDSLKFIIKAPSVFS